MPIYVPREIIHAAGMLPVGIVGGGDQLEVIHGDAYYQSYICRIPRSTIELGVTGPAGLRRRHAVPVDLRRDPQPLRHVEDDVPKDKYVRYFDVPQNYQDEHRRQLLHPRDGRCCATTSASLRGKPITDDELRASIAVYNENRRAGARPLRIPRRTSPGRRRPPRSTCCCAPGMVLPVEEHTMLVRDYLAAADAEARPMRDNARVVLTGAFCEQPPLNLIKSIEMAGCYIVDDDFMLVTRWLTRRRARPTAIRCDESVASLPAPLGIDGGQIRAESRRTRASICSTRSSARGAEGVIFAAPELLRSGAARAADAAGRAERSTTFPTSRSNTPRTPARCSRSASRPAPLPIRSNCGAQHDTSSRRPKRAAKPRSSRTSMLKQKEMINRHYDRAGHAHRDRQQGRGHLRAGQPQRTDDVLRLRCATCPRSTPAERHAQEVRQATIMEAEHDGHSEDVCTYVKSDLGMMARRQYRPERQAAAAIRTCCCCPTPAASPS